MNLSDLSTNALIILVQSNLNPIMGYPLPPFSIPSDPMKEIEILIAVLTELKSRKEDIEEIEKRRRERDSYGQLNQCAPRSV